MTDLQTFLDSPAGIALIAMVGVAFADFLTGSFAALRDGTFSLDVTAAFLRKHLAGRVGPIGVLLSLGYFGGDTIGGLFMASAIASATAYVAETASSILGNVSPPKRSDIEAAALPTTAELLNPVPVE